MASLAVLEDIVSEFPEQLRLPVRHLSQWAEETFKVPRDDFIRLEHAVERLTEAQIRTEQRLDALTEKVQELAAAQIRTEQRLDALTEKVQELAAAQTRTEQQVLKMTEAIQQLAVGQKNLEHKLDRVEKTITDQIASLGSRWGIYNEGTFRATIQGVFRKMDGITVKSGYYGDREIDVIIRDGEHILLEITSRMHSHDIKNLYRSADDYYRREHVKPTLMVATSYVSPKLMQKIMGLERPIEIFSYDAEEPEEAEEVESV